MYFRVLTMVTVNGFQMLLLMLAIYFIFWYFLSIRRSLPSISVRIDYVRSEN